MLLKLGERNASGSGSGSSLSFPSTQRKSLMSGRKAGGIESSYMANDHADDIVFKNDDDTAHTKTQQQSLTNGDLMVTQL